MRSPLCLWKSSARIAFAAGTALLAAGCTLVAPGCRNRDVSAAIEQEARQSIDLWLATSTQSTLPRGTYLRLVDAVELNRKEATRACLAKIAVGSGDKRVEVHIEYEVIAGDNGQAFYRWDKDEFGKTFIGTSIFSLLSKLAPQTPQTEAPEGSEAREPSQPADKKPAQSGSDPSPGEIAERNQLVLERWHDSVTAAINAQATHFRIEGSGSVSLAFTVSAAGDLSDVKVVRGSGNSQLDRVAVQMVERAGRVPAPPNQQAMSFTMKLSFL